jgi:alkaline phosphatase
MLLVAFVVFCFLTNHAFAESVPKNIIVMISDGCGYNQINVTSLYQYGKIESQTYDRFPVKLWVSTYSSRNLKVSEPYKEGYEPDKAWTWFDYVKSGATDSAASATAMATGFKTYNSAIGVGVDKKPLKNISQRAKELGKAVGVVTNVQFSHATPASFLAHNESRGNYAGIAQEMILDTKADVIMGCGNPLFDNNGKPVTTKINYEYVGGESVWNGLINGTTDFDLNGDNVADNSVEDCDGDGVADPWKLIQDISEFRSLTNGATPKRVIGVPKVFETLQCRRSPIADRNGDGKMDDKDSALVSKIYEDPFTQNIPSLREMVKGTLNVLDNNPKGFFLVVEGGTVDWAAGSSSLPRLIEEEIDFNNAVDSVVSWIEKNSNWKETILIITGDHETGYITGPGSGPDNDDPKDAIKPVWAPLKNNGVGKFPGMEWHSSGHTNSLLPIFVKGVGSKLFVKYADEHDPVRGAYIDDTEIAKVMFDLWTQK